MDEGQGFTLVELLIAVAVIASVLSLAVPGFVNWLPDYRLRSAVHDLFSNFQKAKMAAVKRNTNTVVCFNGSGYVIFIDPDQNFKKDGSDDAVAIVSWKDYKSVSLDPAAITFDSSSGQPCIGFRPDGIPADNGGGFASGTAPIVNTNNRTAKVVISQAGHIRID